MYVGVLGKGRKVGIPMNEKGVGVKNMKVMTLQMKVKKLKEIA